MNPKEFRDIRGRLDLTQDELAKILGIANYLTISHYESGFRRPSETVQRLMRIFDEWPEKKSLELREDLKAMGEKENSRSRKKS